MTPFQKRQSSPSNRTPSDGRAATPSIDHRSTPSRHESPYPSFPGANVTATSESSLLRPSDQARGFDPAVLRGNASLEERRLMDQIAALCQERGPRPQGAFQPPHRPAPLNLEGIAWLNQPGAGLFPGGVLSPGSPHPLLGTLQTLQNLANNNSGLNSFRRSPGSFGLRDNPQGAFGPRDVSPRALDLRDGSPGGFGPRDVTPGAGRTSFGAAGQASARAESADQTQIPQTPRAATPDNPRPRLSHSLLSPLPAAEFPPKEARIVFPVSGTELPRPTSGSSFNSARPPIARTNAPREAFDARAPPNPLQHLDQGSIDSLEEYLKVLTGNPQVPPEWLLRLAAGFQAINPPINPAINPATAQFGNDFWAALGALQPPRGAATAAAAAAQPTYEPSLLPLQPALFPYGQPAFGNAGQSNPAALQQQLVQHMVQEQRHVADATAADFRIPPNSSLARFLSAGTGASLPQAQSSAVDHWKAPAESGSTTGKRPTKLSPQRRPMPFANPPEIESLDRNRSASRDLPSPLQSPTLSSPTGDSFLHFLTSYPSSPLGSPYMARGSGDPQWQLPSPMDAAPSPKNFQTPEPYTPEKADGEVAKKVPRGKSEKKSTGGKAVVEVGEPRRSSRKRKAKGEATGEFAREAHLKVRRNPARVVKDARKKTERPSLPSIPVRPGSQARSAPSVPVPVFEAPEDAAWEAGRSKYMPALLHILGEINQLAGVPPQRATLSRPEVRRAILPAREAAAHAPAMTRVDRQQLEVEEEELEAILAEVEAQKKEYQERTELLGDRFAAALGIQPHEAEPYTRGPREKITGRFEQVRNAISANLEKVRRRLDTTARDPRPDRRHGPNRVDLRPPGMAKGEVAASGEEKAIALLPPRHMSVRELKERARAFENEGGRARSTTRALSRTSISILRGWLFDHFLHPYPNDEEKGALAEATGLKRGQIANWFINARVRIWKPMIEEMYREAKEKEALGGGGDGPNQEPDSIPEQLRIEGPEHRSEENAPEASGGDDEGLEDALALLPSHRERAPGHSGGRHTTQKPGRQQQPFSGPPGSQFNTERRHSPGTRMPPAKEIERAWLRDQQGQLGFLDSGEYEAEGETETDRRAETERKAKWKGGRKAEAERNVEAEAERDGNEMYGGLLESTELLGELLEQEREPGQAPENGAAESPGMRTEPEWGSGKGTGSRVVESRVNSGGAIGGNENRVKILEVQRIGLGSAGFEMGRGFDLTARVREARKDKAPRTRSAEPIVQKKRRFSLVFTPSQELDMEKEAPDLPRLT